MLENDIVEIHDCTNSGNWTMRFDLQALVNGAGVMISHPAWTDSDGVRYRGSREVDIPLPTAKRIIGMILQYADPEEWQVIDGIFRKNEKLYKAWREKLERRVRG